MTILQRPPEPVVKGDDWPFTGWRDGCTWCGEPLTWPAWHWMVGGEVGHIYLHPSCCLEMCHRALEELSQLQADLATRDPTNGRRAGVAGRALVNIQRWSADPRVREEAARALRRMRDLRDDPHGLQALARLVDAQEES